MPLRRLRNGVISMPLIPLPLGAQGRAILPFH
jgi:hypothetical protein